MTDSSPRRRRPVRTPSPSVTVAGASALFVVTLGVLGVQMARGHDPSLGPAPARVAAAPAPPPVVEHRIVRRVVVTRVVTDAAPVRPAPAAAAAPPAAAPDPVPAPEVVQTSAATPSPAPAVQTRTS